MTMEAKIRPWLLWTLIGVILIGGGFTYWYFSKNKGGTIATTSPTATKSAVVSPGVSPTASSAANNGTNSGSQTATPDTNITPNSNNSKFEGQIGGLGCDPVNASFEYPKNLRVYQGNQFDQNPAADLWLSDPSTSNEFNPSGSSTGIRAESSYYLNQEKGTICELSNNSNDLNTIIDKINNNPNPGYWNNYEITEPVTKKEINGNLTVTWTLKYSVKNTSTPSHPNPPDTNMLEKRAIILNSQSHKLINLGIVVYTSAPTVAEFNTNYLNAYNTMLNSFQFK